MTTAKDSVSDTLSSAVERTRGAVQGGMERTRAVVLESRVVRLVSSGVDTALSTSESLVDQYLPVTEEELGETSGGALEGSGWELNPFFSSELEAQTVEGLKAAAPTYYVRLGWLSARLRKRTYSRAASTIQRSRELMRELQSAELVSPQVSGSLTLQVLILTNPSGPDPVRQEEPPGGQPEAELAVEARRAKPRAGSRRRGNVSHTPLSEVLPGS